MREDLKPNLFQRAVYRFSWAVCRLAFRTLWGVEVRGLENVPQRGRVLLASNHISLADPPLVGSSIFRAIHYFAKAELFRAPGFGWFLFQINAFPVKRFSHDVGAFKRAQRLLELDEAVLLFPEGRRNLAGVLQKAKSGIGMLAVKTGSPVVPVCVAGSNRLRNLRRLRVHFGPPLQPPPAAEDKAVYQSFSEAVMRAIAELQSKM